MKFSAAVITVSDTGPRGDREDTSGPSLCALLGAKTADLTKERGRD